MVLMDALYLLVADRTGFSHLLGFEKDALRVAREQDAVVTKRVVAWLWALASVRLCWLVW